MLNLNNLKAKPYAGNFDSRVEKLDSQFDDMIDYERKRIDGLALDEKRKLARKNNSFFIKWNVDDIMHLIPELKRWGRPITASFLKRQASRYYGQFGENAMYDNTMYDTDGQIAMQSIASVNNYPQTPQNLQNPFFEMNWNPYERPDEYEGKNARMNKPDANPFGNADHNPFGQSSNSQLHQYVSPINPNEPNPFGK